MLHFRVLEQRCGGIGENNFTAFHDIAAMTDPERKLGILLYQQQRHALLGNTLDGLEDFLTSIGASDRRAPMSEANCAGCRAHAHHTRRNAAGGFAERTPLHGVSYAAFLRIVNSARISS